MSDTEGGQPGPPAGGKRTSKDGSMKAQDLTGKHLGKRVTVDGKVVAAAGTLSGVQHRADIILDTPLSQATPSYSLGRQQVVLTFLNGSTMVTEPEAEVAILAD